MIEGYPLLMPLAGLGTIIVMGLGIYLLLRKYSRKQLDKLAKELERLFGSK